MGDFEVGTKVEPLGGRVLVQVFGEQTTPGGIIVPDVSYSKFQIGKVTELSNGKIENGFLYEHQVKEGDVVIFHSQSGYPIDIDDKKYKLMPESDILAIIKGGLYAKENS